MKSNIPGLLVEPVGELRRRCPVVETVELLAAFEGDMLLHLAGPDFEVDTREDGKILLRATDLSGQTGAGTTLVLHQCLPGEWGSKLFKYSGAAAFLEAFVQANPGVEFKNLPDETAIFEKSMRSYVAPEMRENASVLINNIHEQLIQDQDIKGILHVHTTASDGLHSLREMCAYTRSLGYSYIGITDHSQSAFYANGLKPDRVLAQMEEIDQLNAEMAPFRILKGIESDILNDGSLDYEDALLEKFDFVIASVHSNLRMTLEKATERLVRAIEHPCTTILGHPTGRLLLSREGYPLDWDAVFEACVKHQVSIELNANPRRLDLDWSLIPKALAMGIRISINQDAHSKDGILHTRYGVMVARKGGLTPAGCLNALELNHWLGK